MQENILAAEYIIKESIAAVLPDAAVKRALERRTFDRPPILVAIGKAAWRMAKAAYDKLEGNILRGVVITKYEHSEGPIGPLEIYEAGHPVPDENGVAATRRALEIVSGLSSEDTVIFLVSGGGSALFELPAGEATLEDIAGITRQLLACGADISEINTIRKRLSAVKGGRFALACQPANVLCIALSDVLGNSIETIASGPAAPDSTTCAQTLEIVSRYALRIPGHIEPLLHQETPKALYGVEFDISGSVDSLCRAARDAASRLGYVANIRTTELTCEAREAGKLLANSAKNLNIEQMPYPMRFAIILGGETVVHLKGNGKGGRNQEIALAAAKDIDGLQKVCIFSLGSDGTDGPTDAAGGIVTGETAAKIRELGLSIDDALENNDAYPVLKAVDALIMTGPTGTNVNDISVLLIG